MLKEFKDFAMRGNVIDLAVGPSINWSPQIKQLNLFSLPFLISDEKAMDALTHGDVATDIFAVLEKQGVVPLAIGENGELIEIELPAVTREDSPH